MLIQNGRLELDDRKNGRKADLVLDKLTLDSNGPDSRADIEINGSIAGQKFKAKASSSLRHPHRQAGPAARPEAFRPGSGAETQLDGKVKDPRKMSGIKLGIELASTGLVELADERLKGGLSSRPN